MNEKKNEIVLDLKSILKGDTMCYPLNELIHREQIERVAQILKERVEMADEYMHRQSNELVHLTDVISVFARRGAGKTTFVESLVNLIRYSKEMPFSDLGENICCLDVLDPNHIEKKENLTVRFISQIHEVFKKYIDSHYCEPCCCKHSQYDEECNGKKEFELAAHQLYEALPVIDGIGDESLYSEWDDTGYVAEKKMELTIRIKELEKRFHRYISAGLHLIHKKALLFVLDDCDIKIDNTFQILEIIRLYFTSPQIIVMLTGDAALYGMAIRKNYWKYFDQDFLSKEGMLPDKEMKNREYRKMVYRLETQYFQKMIKPEHRIFLNNLYDKNQEWKNHPDTENSNCIKIKFHDGKESRIEEVYEDAFALMGISKRNPGVYADFLQHFLAQPFRNQIRFFSIYSQALKYKGTRYEISRFVIGVLKVFEAYINQHSGDSKYLMAHTPIYPAWLLKFLIENNILVMGSSFLPEMEDSSLKNALIALGFSCTEQMRYDKSMIFDYWIRISLSRQWLELFKQENNAGRLVKHAHLYADWGLMKILGGMSAYITRIQRNVIKGENTKSIPGLIECKSTLRGHDNTMDETLIQLLQLQTIAADGHVSNYFSIYQLFAFLGELLVTDKSLDKEGKHFEPLDVYWNLFKKCSQIRSYVETSEDVNSDTDEEFSSNAIEMLIQKNGERNNTKDYTRFGITMKQWVEDFNTEQTNIAPYWINHVFSRFFYTIYHSNNHVVLLGEQISDMILAFWNALIVEAFIANGDSRFIETDHLGNIKELFFENYFWFLVKSEDLVNSKFISYLISCPLLEIYVDPDIINILKKLQNDIVTDDKLKENLKKSDKAQLQSYYDGNIKILLTDKMKSIQEKLMAILNFKIIDCKAQCFILRESREKQDELHKREQQLIRIEDALLFADLSEAKTSFLKAERKKLEIKIRKLRYDIDSLERKYSYVKDFNTSLSKTLRQQDYLEIRLDRAKDKLRECQEILQNVPDDYIEQMKKNSKEDIQNSVYSILNKYSNDLL